MIKKNASMVGIIWGQNILLCRTKRNPNYWQPVGGGQKSDEVPIDTAIREIKEEINLTTTSNNLYPMPVYPSKTGGEISFYLTNIKLPSKADLSEHEAEEREYTAIYLLARVLQNHHEIVEAKWFGLVCSDEIMPLWQRAKGWYEFKEVAWLNTMPATTLFLKDAIRRQVINGLADTFITEVSDE